eukprot:1308231-Amphidinium_carterae.1
MSCHTLHFQHLANGIGVKKILHDACITSNNECFRDFENNDVGHAQSPSQSDGFKHCHTTVNVQLLHEVSVGSLQPTCFQTSR